MSGTTKEDSRLTEEQRAAIARKIQHVNQVLARARTGDETILPELRKLLDEEPKLWTEVADLAECTIFAWAKLISGKNLLMREAIVRDFWARTATLISRKAGPMERMLGQQVALCRLQLLHAESVLAQSANDAFTKKADVVDKRITACQKRLSRAHKDLLAYQRSQGITAVTVATKSAEGGLDPAQRAAADLNAASNRSSNPSPSPADSLRKQKETAETGTQTTDLPLKPPVAGTQGVVTSENNLEQSCTPNDSIFTSRDVDDLTTQGAVEDAEEKTTKRDADQRTKQLAK